MDQRFSLRIGLVALVAMMAMGGCGRKGPLELPANAPPTPAQASADAAQTRILPVQDSPGLIQPPDKFVDQPASLKLDRAVQNPQRAINAPPAATGKPFVLDPLL